MSKTKLKDDDPLKKLCLGTVSEKISGGLKLVSKFHTLFPRLNKMAGKAKDRNLFLNLCSKFNVIFDRNPLSKFDEMDWGHWSYPETLIYQKNLHILFKFSLKWHFVADSEGAVIL